MHKSHILIQTRKHENDLDIRNEIWLDWIVNILKPNIIGNWKVNFEVISNNIINR